MKKLLFFLPSILLAQSSSHLIYVNSPPSGACQNAAAMQRVISSGDVWNCVTGTWAKVISGGGGAGSVAFGAITSGTNSTAAMVVGMGASFTVPTQASGDISGLASSDLFVANAFSFLTPYGSVQAATIAILSNTPTYNNGTAGVGATLTAGSNGVLTIDGYSPVLNDRVLVKNQASALQNGVYQLTTVGTVSVPYILTRAPDYNNLVDINFTGDIQVIQGSTLNGEIWYLNGKITVVGTSALNYSQNTSNVNSANGNVKATGNLTAGNVVTGAGGKTIQDSDTALSALALLASPTFTGNPAAPTQSSSDNSTKLATTAYVTTGIANAVAGVNPAVAVLAASTINLTGTYVQVGGGIGDTFTITATGTFSLDGIAINTIGQRVLLKNQSTASQNGVYIATIVGAVAVSPVFTRALDYDTPSDVNNTGAIPVQSGTVNALTSWLLTSQVTSIGSAGSALTYSQFSISPSVATQTIASGTISLGTTTVNTGTCDSSPITLSATGVATTDTIIATANADPTGVTGYTAATTGTLYIWAYPTLNTINVKRCNNTSANITPGSAVTLNVRVVR
jgi:hypothetical protein